MNITLQKDFEAVKDKNEFYITWIMLNKHNLDIKIVDNNIIAFEKDTDNIIVTASIPENRKYDYEVFDKDFIQKDFDIRFTANIGQEVYVLNPDIDLEIGRLTFKRENIYKALVTGISGANDMLCTISHINMETTEPSSIVQEAVFENYDDAVKACNSIPENGVETWYDYIELVKEYIKYNYKLVVPVQRGQELYIPSKYSRKPVLKNRLINGEYFAKTKINRLIMCVRNGKTTDIITQTTGNLYYADLNEFVDLSNRYETLLSKDGYKSTITYNNKKVFNLSIQYDLDLDECKIVKIGE